MNSKFPYGYFAYQYSTHKTTELFRAAGLKINKRQVTFECPFLASNQAAFERLFIRHNPVLGTIVVFDHAGHALISIPISEDLVAGSDILEANQDRIVMRYESACPSALISRLDCFLKNIVNSKSYVPSNFWATLDSLSQAQYAQLLMESSRYLAGLQLPRSSVNQWGAYKAPENKNTILIYDEALTSPQAFLLAFSEEAFGAFSMVANDLISFQDFGEDCLRGLHNMNALELLEFESVESLKHAMEHPELKDYMDAVLGMGFSTSIKPTA